jgi:hypothetical protein
MNNTMTLRTIRIPFFVLAAACTVGLSSCKRDKEETPAPITPAPATPQASARMAFHFMDDGTPFTLGGEVMDADGRLVRITKLRFFVSSVHAEDDAENTVADYDGVYLLVDAAGDNDFPLGALEASHIHEFHFDLGVDSATNHSDMTEQTEPPLNDPTTTWLWNQDFGYKFIDIEGRYDSDGNGTVDDTDESFQMHAAGDDLLTEVHGHVHHDVVDDETFTAHMNVDVHGLFASVTMAGVMHMDLLGTTPRTIQVMANLATGVEAVE